MMKNIGTADRLARILIGIVLLGAGIFFGMSLNPLLGLLIAAAGIFSVFEGVAGWCAVYALLGKNTCPVREP